MGFLRVIRKNECTVCRAEARVKELEEALREIKRGEGSFHPDPYEHASNVIYAMKDIAERVLRGEEER
jgi:hypothetical protein